MCGFIAQLVEHRTGIAEVTGSNPVEALIFFQASSFQLLKLEIYCDDHSSLSFLLKVRFMTCLVIQHHVRECNNKHVVHGVPYWEILKEF